MRKKPVARKAPLPSAPKAVNRKARFDYSVLETFEAGLVLTGSEVKSLRAGNCRLKDSYLVFKRGEPYIQNVYIAPYKPAGSLNHAPERRRKLLLNKREIQKLTGQLHQKGLSCVPLKVYFKKSRAKMELALVRGKRKWDKREAVKKREMDRVARRAVQKVRPRGGRGE